MDVLLPTCPYHCLFAGCGKTSTFCSRPLLFESSWNVYKQGEREGAKKIMAELLDNQPAPASGGLRSPTPNGLLVTAIKFVSVSWTEHSPLPWGSSYFSVRGGSKEDGCCILGSKPPTKYVLWNLTPSLVHKWSDWSLKVNLSSFYVFSERQKHLYYHEEAT